LLGQFAVLPRFVVAANQQEFLWDYALAWEVVGAAGP
jgi:hypothetical protein